VSATRDAAREWGMSALAALAVVAALGVVPTLRLAGREGLSALAAGCAVSAVGAMLGAVPVLRAVARGGAASPVATFGAATATRLVATLAGALEVALGSELPRAPLLIWVGLAYGALLVAETRWMARWLGAGNNATVGHR